MLEVRNVRCGYGKQEVLHGVDFTATDGQTICLLGMNGCGKTTLLKALMRILPVSGGEILLNGKEIHDLTLADFAAQVAYIPQTHQIVFPYSVYEMVLMGRSAHIPAFRAPSLQDHAAVRETLQWLHMEHLMQRSFLELSGGQRRLVMIARALCQQARLLLMDEPTADLDFANQQLILDTIARLKAQGYCVLLSTHAPDIPFAVADHVLLLRDGQTIAFGETEKTLTQENLCAAFGVQMEVLSMRDTAGTEHRMIVRVGERGN